MLKKKKKRRKKNKKQQQKKNDRKNSKGILRLSLVLLWAVWGQFIFG